MRYNIQRTREGGVVVTFELGGRATNDDKRMPAEWWNNQALIAHRYNKPQWSRSVDTSLLAAQYEYGNESERWESVRPSCTHGSFGAGYCSNETEYGDLYCTTHGGRARVGVVFR